MRIPVDLPKSYRLLNHGPTVLVSSAHEGRKNVMAAAWNMPLDFDPPKIAVVIAGETFTRELVEASHEFCLCVPAAEMAALTYKVGSISGRSGDKFETLGITYTKGTVVEAPLVDGCVAWLECRVISEPHFQQAYDLFLGEVVAAWADDRDFREGRWAFSAPGRRTLHHVSGGAFFAPGELLQASED